MLRWLTYKYKITRIVVISLNYTQITVLGLFNVCGNHVSLNYNGQES